MLETSHPFYADRMLVLGLAERGSLVFDPAVDTLYRVYAGNWQASQDPKLVSGLLSQGSDAVHSLAASKNIDLPALWRSYPRRHATGVIPEVNR